MPIVPEGQDNTEEQSQPEFRTQSPIEIPTRQGLDVYNAPTPQEINAANARAKAKTFDEGVEIFKLSQQSGLPSEYVADHKEAIRFELNKGTPLDSASFMAKSPDFAKWAIQDPNRIALVKDQIMDYINTEKSIKQEKEINETGSALIGGIAGFAADVSRIPYARLSQMLAPVNLAGKAFDINALENLKPPAILLDNKLTKELEEIEVKNLSSNEAYNKSIWDQAIAGDVKGAANTLYVHAAANAPQMVFMLATGGVGLAVAGLSAMGGSLKESEERAKAEGREADPLTSTTAASIKGAAEVAFESMGTLRYVKKMIGDISAKAGTQTAKELALNFSKHVIGNSLQEGAEEAGTEVVQSLADYLTGNDPDGLKNIFSKTVDAALVGGAMGGSVSTVSGYAAVAKNKIVSKKIDTQKNVFQYLSDLSSRSKLRENLPESFTSALDGIIQGKEIDKMYVPVEAAEELFQSYEGGTAKAMQDLEASESYERAKENNGYVEIKTSTYMTKMAGADLLRVAMADMTFDPNVPTANEFKAEQEKISELRTKKIKDGEMSFEEAVQQEFKQAKDGRTVEQRFYDILKPLMPEREARTNARLQAAIATQIAEGSGITAEQLLADRPLKVTNELSEQVRRFTGREDIKTQEPIKAYAPILKVLRAGLKQPVPTGKTLTQKIRELGGVNDEVFGADLPSNIKRKTGKTFAELAPTLIQEGYLAEGQTEADLLEMIQSDLSGEPVYSSKDINQDLQNEYEAFSAVESGLRERGFDYDWYRSEIQKLDEKEALLRGKEQDKQTEYDLKQIAKSRKELEKKADDFDKELIKQIESGVLDKVQEDKAELHQSGIKPPEHKREKKTGRYVGAPEIVGNSDENLEKLREIVFRFAKEGEAGRFWYEDSSAAILKIVGGNVEEAEKLTMAIALTSPQSDVSSNTTIALKAYWQYKNGQQIRVKTDDTNKKLNKALYEGNTEAFDADPWEGKKTASFYHNLMVGINPKKEVGHRVTVDMWMARAFGYKKDTMSPQQYGFVEKEIQYVAEKLGWTPMQVQAAMWSAVKTSAESENGSKAIGGKGETLESEKKYQEKIWKYISKNSAKPEDVAKSYYNYSHAINERIAQINFEANPSTSVESPVSNIGSAPLSLQSEYLQAVVGVLYKDGENQIGKALGFSLGAPENGIGVYGSMKSAGARISFPTSFESSDVKHLDKKGNLKTRKDTKVLNAGARNTIELYAAALGYVLKQDSVGYGFAFESETKELENAAALTSVNELSLKDYELLEASLTDKLGVGKFALVHTKGGVRIINLNLVEVEGEEFQSDNIGFQKKVREALAKIENQISDGEFEIKSFRNDGALVENDWVKKGKNGEVYRQRISKSGRPDIQGALDVLQSEIDQIAKQFGAKYGWDKPFRDRTAEQQQLELEARASEQAAGTGEYLQADSTAQGLPDGGAVRRSVRRMEEVVSQGSGTSSGLIDLPRVFTIDGKERRFGRSPLIASVAEKYMAAAGLPYNPPSTYKKADRARGKKIADAYEAMKHDPSNAEVKAAYEAMANETIAQWNAIKETGLKVEFIKDGNDPYGDNPRNAIIDIIENNHLWVYPTSSGFGSDASVDVSDNPLLRTVEGEIIDGRPVVVNDIFRIVHDYFGHAKEGNGFRADGEETAWRVHSAMYSELARKAMTSETRGQNSWVNFGKYGKQNRKASGAATIYADQKTGLLPDWVMTEGLEDVELKQSGNEAIRRGGIIFNEDGSSRIKKYASWDKTTFIHEMSHHWLKVLQDYSRDGKLNERMMKVYEDTLAYLGTESLDGLSQEEYTKAQEKFAESFEKYMLEGKSPNDKLRDVFEEVKRWFYVVYIALKKAKLDVELNDEIRSVFDRLISSDADIQAAKEEIAAQPLILNSESVLDPYQVVEFEKLKKAEESEAQNKVRAKKMKFLSNQAKAQRKERESVIRPIIEKQVGQEQDQVAYSMIVEGKLADGTDNPVGKDALKISMQAAAKIIPPSVLEKLPKTIFNKNGSHPDAVASIVGYGNGVEMLNALANRQNKKDRIEEMVKARLNEEFPDPANSTDHGEGAIRALMNDAGGDRRFFELKWLINKFPSEAKRALKSIARRTLVSRESVKNKAKEIIGNMSMESINPYIFRRTMVRYENAAMDAFVSGRLEEAIEAKYMAQINFELHKLAIEIQEQWENDHEKMIRFFKKDSDLAKSYEMDFIYAARSLVAQYGVGIKQGGDPFSFIEKTNLYGDDSTGLKGFLMNMISNATFEGKVSIGDLSFNQYDAVKTAFDALVRLGREARQITIDGKKQDTADIVQELNAQIDLHGKKINVSRWQSTGGKGFEVKKLFVHSLAYLFRVESFANFMDLGDKSGAFKTKIVQPVLDAVYKYRLKKKDVYTSAKELFEKNKDLFTEEKIVAPELRWVNITGVYEQVVFENKAELLGTLLHIGNDSNKKKLIVGFGGGVINEKGELDAPEWDSFFERIMRDGTITKQDMDFLQSIWDLLESLKPDTQKAHKEIYGTYFAEVTGNEIKTPWGVYRGGYFPAKIDADHPLAKNAGLELEQLEGSVGAGSFPAQTNGHTKTRNENYRVPLKRDLKLALSHIDQVLRFTYIVPTTRKVFSIVTNKSFRGKLSEVFGGVDLIETMIIPWLDRTNRQSVIDPKVSVFGKLSTAIRNNTGVSAMALNITNTIQQLIGFSIASAKVSPKYLARSFAESTRNRKELFDQASKMSAFMQTKLTGQAAEVAAEIESIVVNPTKAQKANEFVKKNAYVLQTTIQNYIDVIVWNAAFSEAIYQKHSEDAAVKIADSAVRTTQGTFAPEDVARYETGHPFYRLFTMFSGYFNMTLNLKGTEAMIAICSDIGLKKKYARLAFLYIALMALPAAMNGALYALMGGKGFDSDDDDEYLDDVMKMFFMEQVKGELAQIPFLGSAAMTAINKTNNNPFDDRFNVSPVINSVESILTVPKEIKDAASGKDIKPQAVTDVLTMISIFSGVPVKPLAKPITYQMKVEQGKAKPEGALDYTRGLVTGR